MASATVITHSISALAISLLRRAKNCCSPWALLHLKGWISSSGISTLLPDISRHIRQVGRGIRRTAELHVTPRQCQLFVLLFSCAELNPGPTGMSKRKGVEPFSMVTLSTDVDSTPPSTHHSGSTGDQIISRTLNKSITTSSVTCTYHLPDFENEFLTSLSI